MDPESSVFFVPVQAADSIGNHNDESYNDNGMYNVSVMQNLQGMSKLE